MIVAIALLTIAARLISEGIYVVYGLGLAFAYFMLMLARVVRKVSP